MIDGPDNAQNAADEIALTQVSRAPATRLELRLDLAPAEADRDRLSIGRRGRRTRSCW